MSGQRKIPTVGENFTINEVQRMANVAAAGDDRALEIMATPGSTQKKIHPLSEETPTLNPRLLIVGHDTDAGVPNGSVRLRPAHFVAGVANGPYDIGLGAKQKVNLDSPQFAANTGGAARTDLLYATISYSAITTVTKKQKPPSGGVPLAQPLPVAADTVVTLGIVAGVPAANPQASLPADPAVDPVYGGTYNFALAAVAIPAGYVAGAPINQASIAPLWNGGWIQPQRIQAVKPVSFYSGSAAEKPISAFPNGFRSGSARGYFFHLRMFANTSGLLLDNSLDWRRRIVWGNICYLGSGALSQLEMQAGQLGAQFGSTVQPGGAFLGFSGNGGAVGGTNGFAQYTYGGAQGQGLVLQVNAADGSLCLSNTIGTVLNGNNGDLIACVLFALDQDIPGM
jgi:hypothetical protein